MGEAIDTPEMRHQKIDAEISKLLATTAKLNAETRRINRETGSYPLLPLMTTVLARISHISLFLA